MKITARKTARTKTQNNLMGLLMQKKGRRELDDLYINGNDPNMKTMMRKIAGNLGPKQKIVIVGSLHCNREQIYELAAEMEINRKQVEICDDYKKLKNTGFGHLRNNPVYAGILVGEVPHHTKDTENYNSATGLFSRDSGFPPCEIISTISGKLKMTKTSLKTGLMHLMIKIGEMQASPGITHFVTI